MSLIVNSTSLEVGLRTLFLAKMREVANYVGILATEVSSDKNLENYAWMYQLPKIREFIGPRVYKDLGTKKYTVQNKTWESSIAVRREHLEDNQVGDLPIRIASMAENARDHVNELLVDLLINGADSSLGLCYDGTPFFYASHPALAREGGVQANTLSGTGVTLSALQTDFEAAIGALRRFKDEGGKPFRRSWGRMIVCAPPEQEFNWRKILQLPTVSTAGANVYAGLADLMILPELTDTTDWFLLHTGGVVKPLIFQNRVPVEFEAQAKGSEIAFEQAEFHYGTYARYAGAYGFWQDAVRTTNS